MAEYKVVELFTSINGEGVKAGQLAVFVRFAGCNLKCDYCDTSWANESGAAYTVMNEDEILAAIQKEKVRNVTLTGGEPLYREDMAKLLDKLLTETGLNVEIETNGSMDLREYVYIADKYGVGRLSFTMDYKLPDSGMEDKMNLVNMKLLKGHDTVKFVCSGIEDMKKAEEIIRKYELVEKCHVYLSPVFGKINPADMVEFMKERNLNGVNLQLQLHKFIWDPMKRGV